MDSKSGINPKMSIVENLSDHSVKDSFENYYNNYALKLIKRGHPLGLRSSTNKLIIILIGISSSLELFL